MMTKANSQGSIPVRAALCIVFYLMGCHAHLKFEPLPSREAPAAERISAYKKYRPAAIFLADQPYIYSQTQSNLLLLQNGARVYFSEDLIPIVGPESNWATVARKEVLLRNWANGTTLGSLGLFLVGSGIGFAGLSNHPAPGSMLISGFIVGALGVLGLLAAFILDNAADQEKRSAFALYDSALSERLGVPPH
jgi:hypothetical protein